MRLTKKNVADGLKAVLMLRNCPDIAVCLWYEIDEKIPEELDIGCRLYASFLTDGGKEKYNGECPIYKIRREMVERSPCFLRTWRNFAGEDPGFPKQNSSLWLSVEGIATLYSANGDRVPLMSEDFIKNVVKQARENPRIFYPAAGKELVGIHPTWFKEFGREAIDFKVSNYSWGWIILLLKIFLEGMELTEATDNRETMEDVEKFFKQNKQNKGCA